MSLFSFGKRAPHHNIGNKSEITSAKIETIFGRYWLWGPRISASDLHTDKVIITATKSYDCWHVIHREQIPFNHWGELIVYNFCFNLVIFYRQATKPGRNDLKSMNTLDEDNTTCIFLAIYGLTGAENKVQTKSRDKHNYWFYTGYLIGSVSAWTPYSAAGFSTIPLENHYYFFY